MVCSITTIEKRLESTRSIYCTTRQNRYEELTGWKCPVAGGPDKKSLTPEQREADREARLIISREMGHDREAVVSAYIGR